MEVKGLFQKPLMFYVFAAFLTYAVVKLSISFFTTNVMGGIIDENVKNNQFRQGYICFYDYKPESGSKSQGLYDNRAYFYYFYIDGKKSQNLMKPYFPFKGQWNIFIKNMDRKQCYKATYVEAKFLFFTQRRIYKVFNETVPSPYFKGEN